MSVSVDYAIRTATPADADFIVRMVIQAANWDSRRRLPEADIVGSPLFKAYFEDWPRDGDHGLIACHDDEPIGAAWLRFHEEPEQTLAGLEPDIPVIALGVVGSWQNRGVGRALLRSLVNEARSLGYRAVSLSVDPASFASRIARSMGFTNAGTRHGNHIMRLDLIED